MRRSATCRVVVIGAGRVGSHCALSLVAQHLADEVVLIDVNADLARAQAADLEDFSCGMGRGAHVRAGSYADCDEASVILVCAGRGRRPGETRLQLLGDTIVALDDISSRLRETRFDGMLVCVTNPVDIAAEYLLRRTGLPSAQVVGTGTALDTIRLRRTLAEKLGVDADQIQGFCMGEHGDSSFVAWSHVSVAGVGVSEYLSVRPGLAADVLRADVQRRVHNRGADIICGKGCTEFGVGSVVTDVVSALRRGQTRVCVLSAHLSGHYGQDGICAGTPCVIGPDGVEQVLEVSLTPDESLLMDRSCAIVRERLTEGLAL